MPVRTHCTCTYKMFGMDRVGDALIVRRPACLGSHSVLVYVQCMSWTAWAAYVVYTSAYACKYAPCLYLDNVWHGKPERRTLCTRVFVLVQCSV